MVFPVVMYRCESWTIKKAEHWRMMLLNCGAGEDSWESLDFKQIKPVNPKGNQPWIFIGRTGKDWRQKEKGQQRMTWSNGIMDSMDMYLSKLQEIVKNNGNWHATAQGLQRIGHDLVTEQQLSTTFQSAAKGRNIGVIISMVSLLSPCPSPRDYIYLECVKYPLTQWGYFSHYPNIF